MPTHAHRTCFACLLTLVGCIPRDLAPLNPCVTSVVTKEFNVRAVDEVDLLFVIDNSNSMAEEQEALQRELPRMIEGLVSGDPDLDPSTEQFPPVKSLRVAVVSTDLGVNGVGTAALPRVPTCGLPLDGSPFVPERARYGDNGVFNRIPIGAASVLSPAHCDGEDVGADPDTLSQETLPSFLTFDPEGTLAGAAFADRIACYGVLGASGCGFEQQLESMLKSITPSTSEIRFHAEAGSPESGGQGDRANAGWLRDDALLAVLMVTDEDDCSASDPRVFDWRASSPYEDTPLPGDQALSRCARFGDEPVDDNPNGDQPSLLHAVTRYAEGLVALKGGDASKVVFALITGVPTDSVNGPRGENDGVSNLDAILDPETTPAMRIDLIPNEDGDADGDVAYSCSRCSFGNEDECPLGFRDLNGNGSQDPPCIDEVGGTSNRCDPGEALNCTGGDSNGNGVCELSETEVLNQSATPPRRLVRTAQALQTLGASVIVQSICQDSFSEPVTRVLEQIAEALNGACLPNPLHRVADQTVSCNVVETLPLGRTCADLAPLGRTLSSVLPDGREACRITQVAVGASVRALGQPPAAGPAGWFYDDFTEAAQTCGRGSLQRISFTTGAEPTIGARMSLDCVQPVPGDLPGPDIGKACTPEGRECEMDPEQVEAFQTRHNVPRSEMHVGSSSGPLVCQSVTNTCEIGCVTDADCPGGYACFTEALGNPGTQFCANPICPR